MRSFIRTLGETRTVVLSTHILSEVEAVCDRVIIISNGAVAAQGTLGEIRAMMGGDLQLHASVRGAPEVVQASFETLPFATEVSAERNPTQPELTQVAHRDRAALGDPRLAGAERVERGASEGGVRLIDLRVERPSLEEVFAHLTDGSGPLPGARGGPALRSRRRSPPPKEVDDVA